MRPEVRDDLQLRLLRGPLRRLLADRPIGRLLRYEDAVRVDPGYRAEAGIAQSCRRNAHGLYHGTNERAECFGVTHPPSTTA